MEVELAADGSTSGVLVRHADARVERLAADTVVLATGGIGGLYRFTTNPTSSRGTGIALAARAGARLADLEFVQFHPTALDVPNDPLPLVTEALRGEGALLVDGSGRRIMVGIDPALELAARDVVARRVFAVRHAGDRVYLDARAAVGDHFPVRFPTVYAACMRFGIDPRVAPIPVVAAAHYHMGGIAVDVEGRTSVPGLYACGEVAATGVHGANRLASNSLLESVVYPERIARDVRARERSAFPGAATIALPVASDETAAAAQWNALRETMYSDVGVERDEAGLTHAVETMCALGANTRDAELRDAATVAALIAGAALRRRETRGSHVRIDHPAATARERHRSYSTLADLPVAARSA
ncbi:MAG: FAD-binding protein [Candidatus Eremiobacteraeota bacterium]|nr:FAD-binding protein [Candidatus Eremiobacteraeota bacterium]